MNYTLLNICIISLLSFSLIYSPIQLADENDDFSIKIIEDNINIKYKITEINNTTFTSIEIPGNGYTVTEGNARLPLKRYMVEIPYNSNPKIEIISIQWNKLSLDKLELPSKIIPVQRSYSKDYPKDYKSFVINEKYYSSDEFKQTNTTCIRDIGIIRGHRFALIEISPVQYNPSSGELRIMNSFEIKINLKNCDLIKTNEKYNRYRSKSYDDLYENLFTSNSKQGYGSLNSFGNKEGYLIITNDTYYDEMSSFVSWKNSIGFNVTITNTSDIPGGLSKANLSAYIEEAYRNWSTPPSYILLVGDIDQIPSYYGTTSGDTAQAVDLYYVTVDGTDFLPDIHIGRFPASSESEVVTMVNKTMFYERGNFSIVNWIKKAAFMAGNDNYHISEGTHNYVINNNLNPLNYTCDKIYEQTYGATTQNITDSLDDGRSLAIFSGHGSYFSWVDGPQFTQSNIQGLNNQDMYPFVCSHACKTGCFNIDECFGETWLRESNKGAIAFWGASYKTYWDEDDILEKATFQAWLNDSIKTVGGMTDMGLYYLYQNYSGGGNTKYYFEIYNVLGDPSLKIWYNDPTYYDSSEIRDVKATPDKQEINKWVNITCNVTDDFGVDEVKVNITDPNGSFQNVTMNCILIPGSDTDIYYFSNNYSIIGNYSFHIWVNDSQGNQNKSNNHSFQIGNLFNVSDLNISWNLFSIPFNQTIDKTYLIVEYNGTNYQWDEAISDNIISQYIFGWNRSGQGYMIKDTLIPGEGYWIFASDACTIKMFSINISYGDHITTLKSYWNIFGIPFNTSIDKDDIIIEYNGSVYNWSTAVSEGIFGDFVFGWNRNLHSYSFYDTFYPGYAYWFYSYESCLLKH